MTPNTKKEGRHRSCRIQHLSCWMKSIYQKQKISSGPKEEVTVKAIRRDHWQVALVKSGHSHGETLYVKWLQEFRMQEIFLRYENVWANINLEAELVEIQKRPIMSPAKLIYKVIKNICLCNSNQVALTVTFHFLLSLEDVSVWFCSPSVFPLAPMQQSCRLSQYGDLMHF